MRVLQLIDSLRPGGAEKMAVNIANALLPFVEGSYLCCTRQEGMLRDQVKPEVEYLFLNKRSSIDPQAFFRLRTFIRENGIDIVHAHSTSLFLAGLLKLTGGRFNLIWHDHYGQSENLEERDIFLIKRFSNYLAGIISVNPDLKSWALSNLNCNNVVELNNFVPKAVHLKDTGVKLKGCDSDFKIICVANLRPQKDHLNLLKAFELLEPELGITLHLVGVDPRTSYSAKVIKRIAKSDVEHKIFYYGPQKDILFLLQQANVGVLSSRSEGLPIALLEYGMAGLPVLCTNVGKCLEVVGQNGKVVEAENAEVFSIGIRFYYENESVAKENASNLHEFVKEKFSEEKVISQVVQYYLKSSK